MVPRETQVFLCQMGELSTWVLCTRSAILCHPLDYIDSWDKPWWGLSPNLFWSFSLSFLFSNLLAVISQQYPQHSEASSAETGHEWREKERIQELTLQQSSRGDADQLLNLDCEVFPFVFEMGVDAFCTILSKYILFFFFLYSNIEHQSKYHK